MNKNKKESKATDTSIIVSSEQKINKIFRRFFLLSPTVELGLERECTKLDFNQIGEKPIGRGGFGEVWKVIHRDTNKIYCIKLVDKRDMIEQKLINQLNTELEIMYKIHHPHSIKLVNHFEDEEKLYIIMLFASQGTVYSYMRKNQKLDQPTAAQFLREVLSIVEYLHSFDPKIIHRDIKPENLLLDENNRVKLCDYGWACYYSEGEKIKTYCGTPEYVSPEMIKKQGHDHRVDIWSIGVLLFEMLAGYTPFLENSRDELFGNITKIKINWPNDFPVLAKNLVLKILKYSPNDRPTLEEIRSHPWLTENQPIRRELVCPLSSKKEILLSHIINDLSKPHTLLDQSMSSDSEISFYRNGLEFENKSRIEKPLIKINSEDIENDLNESIKRIKNENKLLKIQIINTDNLYMNALKENEGLLHLKKDYEDLKEDYTAINKVLNLYKVREKDREMLLEDIEQKSTQIMMLQKELSNNKLTNITIEALNEKIHSLTTSMQFKDNLITDLTQQINKLHKTYYHEATESLTTVNTESSLSNNIPISESQIDKTDIDTLIDNLSYHLEEKIKTMNQTIATNTFLFKVKDKELSLMISHMGNEITTIISIVKESMIEHINALFNKFSFMSMKSYETMNWLTKKNQELQEEIGLDKRIKDQLDAANEKIKLLNQTLEVFVMKEKADSIAIDNCKSTLANKEQWIQLLEARLSDLKNFIFKKSSNEMLDAFYEQFKGF